MRLGSEMSASDVEDAAAGLSFFFDLCQLLESQPL